MDNNKWNKWAVFSCIIIILFLTILEFPKPIGVETRPQDNVSMIWLVFFLIILSFEIVALSLIFKLPRIGCVFAIISGIFNLLQILADQLHLMQPEIASLSYILLEDLVGLFSIILIYFSWKITKK